MNSTMKLALVTFAIGFAMYGGGPLAQPAYPSAPIKLVIVTPPGGSADSIGRIVAERMTTALGQPVVVENRGGAGGNLASQFVAKAPADGYTLLLTANNHNLNAKIYKDAGYDPRRDFVPVIQLSEGPSVLLTQPDSRFKTIKQVVDAAKAAPGTLAYGSAGFGQPVHIAMELFMAAAQIQLLHVPYKGAGPAMQDALGGQIPLVMSSLAGAMPNITAGKLRALAITGDARWPGLPDVPTMAESGYPAATHWVWLGILAPAGTDSAIVQRLNTVIASIVADPAVRERFVALGTSPIGGTPDAFARRLQADYEAVDKIVARTGMKAE
jgi:tripartite-type tricarboxylate transporter receptor subunit TctC